MGYYLEVPSPQQRFDKAKTLCEIHGGIEISLQEAQNLIKNPESTAVVCVVNNGVFEAAAYCYSEKEFQAFSRNDDHRPKTWLAFENVSNIQKASKYN